MTDDQERVPVGLDGTSHPSSAPNMRSFSLKSAEAEEALCPRADRPWIPNGALPRAPKWDRGESPVYVNAEDDADAGRAFGEWVARVEKGRIANRR